MKADGVEVLVVGGGPAGSTAALRLARRGFRVVLVDRAAFPRRKACGEYFNPEATRLLRELGLIDEVWNSDARPVPALVMGATGANPLSIGFDELPSAAEPAFSLGREVLDTLLLRAAQRAGVDVREQTEAVEPLVERGAVVGARLRHGGREYLQSARLTLAADGLRSRFARKLGLGRGDGGRRKFGIAARCPMRSHSDDSDLIEMRSGGPGCCGIVARGGEANLGMVVGEAWLSEMGGDPTGFFVRQLDQFPELRARVGPPDGRVLTVGPLTWKTRHQHAAGCLLLGDAAGYYDPFTGQGVTFALLTAELAARVGAEALEKGDLSGRALSRYSRARSALLGPRVLVQQVIQAVLERPALRTPVLDRLAQRPEATRRLIEVVADLASPYRLLSPAFLRRLVL